MVTKRTRYRTTINGEERWHDSPPSDDQLADIELFISRRGGHARVDECTTTVDRDLIGTGRGIIIEDRCIFEIEG